MTEDGAEVVRLALNEAAPVAPPAEPPPDAGGERRSPLEPLDRGELPPEFPVEPLGVSGELYWYIDALRQLRGLKAKEHSKLNLAALVGANITLLYDIWPRYNKHGVVTSWRAEELAEALIVACSRRGVWDVWNRVRGPGAWRDAEGRLVFHCGDVVITAADPAGPDAGALLARQPGSQGRHVYPAAPARPRPLDAVAKGGPGSPADRLLDLFGTWAWARPEVDPHLLLGWVCAALLGGALDWRPLVWITGDKATGKSTLHTVLHAVFGEDGILGVSDVSAAGIWQKLGHSTLPVAIDELEAEEDNRKAQNVIKLARQAASGGVILRGGADHEATEFKARSCFLFSSILVPPLLGQDVSRMAKLELQPLGDRRAPTLDLTALGRLGQHLRRRLLDGWPRFPAALESYRECLLAAGHGGRAADQFGNLLACADIALHDHEPDGDNLALWGERLAAATLAETGDEAHDHERCLAHLMTATLDLYRGGERAQVAEHVRTASGRIHNADAHTANAQLARHGLRVASPSKAPGQWLAVANYHQGLAKLFQDTHWAGRSGASGVWVQAMRRVPGARSYPSLRFGGTHARCTLLPIDAVLTEGDDGG